MLNPTYKRYADRLHDLIEEGKSVARLERQHRQSGSSYISFDSVLEQAKHLVETGYKDPAAVLARVVLEDALKRIARAEGIDDTLRASQLNVELKKAGRCPQPQWRLIQAWLDVGNAAAHGKFDEYTANDVTNAINGIEQFLATELRI